MVDLSFFFCERGCVQLRIVRKVTTAEMVVKKRKKMKVKELQIYYTTDEKVNEEEEITMENYIL